MRCASTFFRSEPKVRRDAGLLAVIGFPHAEDVAAFAALRISDDHYATGQPTVADDAKLAIVLPRVLHLEGRSLEDDEGILKVEATFPESSFSLARIVGDQHG